QAAPRADHGATRGHPRRGRAPRGGAVRAVRPRARRRRARAADRAGRRGASTDRAKGSDVSQRLTIATRGSQLALWQAHPTQANHTKAKLLAAVPDLEVTLNVIKTSGDKILDVPLAKVGGKGLFVKEIEQALIEHEADLAVHSMKDVPAELAPGLALIANSSR